MYESGNLHLVHQRTTRWPVNAIACHPTLPLAAIGTGSYDGGWSYKGELLLLDLAAGTAVSLLAHLYGDFVYVTFNSGELVILRAEDGSVFARQELQVDGHPVVPLSLALLSDDGRLAVGTLDGRILVVFRVWHAQR